MVLRFLILLQVDPSNLEETAIDAEMFCYLRLYPQQSAKTSGAVVRVSLIVKDKYRVVAAIAEQRSTKFSNLFWCLYPAGCL